MPLEQTYSSPESLWGTWNITEDEHYLALQLSDHNIPDGLTNPLKRLEFLAGRVLVRALLEKWSEPFAGILKDEFGKPFLTASQIKISLTHSYPHVAAILHRTRNVGIDLEQPKDKLLRIGPRVLSPSELRDADCDIVKHCIYWCAKEALIKIYGKKDLTLSANLRVAPFDRASSGHLIGRIVATEVETTIPLEYRVFDNFVVVVSAD